MTIFAAYLWKTNAELIADCHALGYITDDDFTFDATYGRGKWWTQYRPPRLCKFPGLDFTNMLTIPDEDFSVVAFDPPYVAKGGRTTSTIPEMDAAYGMDDAPRTPDLCQQQIFNGLDEIYRVLKPRGIALVKCMNYISSGKLWLGAHYTLAYALAIGFECVDWFEHLNSGRPQPHEIQVHARRNCSTLYVLRKK